MVSEERPPELVEASSVVAEYVRLIGENGSNDKLFDHTIIPFAKNTDQFWWSVLLCIKPFRSVYSGEQPMISAPDTNKSRTPKEECQLLPRKALEDAKLDVEWLLDDHHCSAESNKQLSGQGSVQAGQDGVVEVCKLRDGAQAHTARQ
jgi:hypothetical protein